MSTNKETFTLVFGETTPSLMAPISSKMEIALKGMLKTVSKEKGNITTLTVIFMRESGKMT